MTETADDQALRDALRETAAFLERVGETPWASDIRKMLDREWPVRIQPNEVLSWFGGPGSLSDLQLSAHNHKMFKEDEQHFNAELNTLTNRLFELAQRLWREERDRPQE